MSRITPQEAAERLSEIRERAAAIIPGPWAWMGNTATDQVYLGTTDRGRLFILRPDTYTVEYVYDNKTGEGHELEEARQHVHERWCFQHGFNVDHDDPGECICDELRDFMRGTTEDAVTRFYDREDRGYSVSLYRTAQIRADLRFVNKPHGTEKSDRKQHGGLMVSYREGMPRYEVLGYRTLVEWERDQGGVIPSAGGDVKDHLYREDFVGLDTPEADFIQNSASDVAWLLSYIAELENRLSTTTTQETPDA